MGSRVGSREGFIYGFLRTELPMLDVSRVKIGGISSPDLGRVQGLCRNWCDSVGVSGIPVFFYSEIVLCSNF